MDRNAVDRRAGIAAAMRYSVVVAIALEQEQRALEERRFLRMRVLLVLAAALTVVSAAVVFGR